MKTNCLLVVLGIISIFSSCQTQYTKYLPSPETIDVNPYGAYISLRLKNKQLLKGELIALDTSSLIVLDQMSKKCVFVSMQDIEKFELKYANHKDYGGAIPLSGLVTLTHGYWLLITLPVNLIVTVSVSQSSRHAFSYNKQTIPLSQLQMFARFPQGIPPGVEVALIGQ
jgi:hypothetical protein